MSEPYPSELEDATATTIFVYRVIVDANSRLTYEEIVEETNLSLRAVRGKTSTLAEKDLIEPCWTVSNRRAFRTPQNDQLPTP